MAQLRTTSKGQLAKYTAGLLSVVGSSMNSRAAVKAGTKSVVVKNNDKNKQTLKKYSQLASSSSTERAALDLILETNVGLIAIGAIDKPKDKGNKGDIAEGILAAAIAARFVNKNQPIDASKVKEIISTLSSKNGKVVEKTYSSPNKNPKIKDTVQFYLSLAESNMKFFLDQSSWDSYSDLFDAAAKYANGQTITKWSKLLYENNQENVIDVISDGVGDQKGTKVDVKVKVDGKATNVNISLKADDVKQFGQVGGSEFEKQITLWNKLAGIDVSELEDKYINLLKKKKVENAVYLVYDYVSNKMNAMLKNKRTKTTLLNNLGSGIQKFATSGEENVTLVQLAGGAAKVYDFGKVMGAIQNLDLSVKIIDSSGKPRMIIEDKNEQSFLEVRVKAEGKPDGSTYIRNYIEKGKLLTSLIATSA